MATTKVPPQLTEIMDKLPPEMKKKIEELRALYAEGSEVGQRALDKLLARLAEPRSDKPVTDITTAGRTGLRQGKVSELTVIAPFAPGGAKRLRALLKLLGSNFGDAGEKVGTVHDMRFVFFDNDTRMLFTTAYDGDWDPYIDDFVAKIPNELDLVFSTTENFPGLATPGIKDWIAKFQITAEAWYVANPDLTVAETKKLARVGKALDEFLDKIG
jgi:Arc/MetJ-type ribon-helix-helix transcriptional regulator